LLLSSFGAADAAIFTDVIPAEAGTHVASSAAVRWVPAFAGMTPSMRGALAYPARRRKGRVPTGTSVLPTGW
jgi:hypothetical protein